MKTVTEALAWLRGLQIEKQAQGHVEFEDVTFDRYGDMQLTCPFCQHAIWITPTLNEKRKYVFAIPHVCDVKGSVTFHVKPRKTVDEVLGLFGDELQDVDIVAMQAPDRSPEA